MQSDTLFSNSIATMYQSYMVPLIFESYATDIAARMATRPVSRVLEIAAGTGVVTRALARVLDSSVKIVATDLNQSMLDQATQTGISRAVEWRQADAMQLPFPDASFDAVVCQFGVMFFPDKAGAFAEVRRVLRDGGVFMFNVWDNIEENEFALTVTEAMSTIFSDTLAQFMARTPHGYFAHDTIEQDLRNGGFVGSIEAETVTSQSRALSAHDVAVAFCQGTPLRNAILAQDGQRLGEATTCAANAITARFGSGAVHGKIQAKVFTVS